VDRFAGWVSTWTLPLLTLLSATWATRGTRAVAAGTACRSDCSSPASAACCSFGRTISRHWRCSPSPSPPASGTA
jgi:hypothetical protein